MTNPANSFFDDLEIKARTVSTGHVVGVPVRYSHSQAMVGHFPAPARLVQTLLPTPKLKPALFIPGTAIVSIAALEYRDISDVEPYNEVSIMVPVQYRPMCNIPGLPLLFHERFRTFGFYIVHLPVTTQQACDFGREFWGFPKFVAEISFHESETTRTCDLMADGNQVLSLSVPRSKVRPCRKSYHTYTQFGGRLVRTKVATDECSTTKRLNSGARLTLGDHPVATELRDLRVKTQSVEYSYAPTAHSILFNFDSEFEL